MVNEGINKQLIQNDKLLDNIDFWTENDLEIGWCLSYK